MFQVKTPRSSDLSKIFSSWLKFETKFEIILTHKPTPSELGNNYRTLISIMKHPEGDLQNITGSLCFYYTNNVHFSPNYVKYVYGKILFILAWFYKINDITTSHICIKCCLCMHKTLYMHIPFSLRLYTHIFVDFISNKSWKGYPYPLNINFSINLLISWYITQAFPFISQNINKSPERDLHHINVSL